MENSCIENPNNVHMLWCPLYTWKFFFEKIKISIFGGILKFLELIVWANLGRFCYKGSG
jgi:hypothetical protein